MAGVRLRERVTEPEEAKPDRRQVTVISRDATSDSEHYETAMRAYSSRQVDDPFVQQYELKDGKIGKLIKPSFPPDVLLRLPNENSMLRQCIDAYTINIDSFGSRFEYIGPEDQQEGKEQLAELDRLQAFVDQPNGEYTLIELRQRLRRDIETLGYGFIEVGRDDGGNVSMIYHVPAHTIRMLTKDDVDVPIKRKVLRNGRLVEKTVQTRFRRFVQNEGNRKTYFKEFGDPRSIDPTDGNVKALGIEDQATELIHFSLYSPGEVYGVPRWINQLPAVLGSRESELTNLQFFKDNAIPAMAVLVSGGTLTEEAASDIKQKFTSGNGRKNVHRVLVIEAVGDEQAASEDGKIAAPRLELKPLASDQQKEGAFQVYEENCAKKIRSSFRLPPIFVGLSEDMTYATANASLTTAENQVFGPERNKMDDVFNQHIFLIDGEQPKFWRFRSLAPRITDPNEVVAALRNMDTFGALTPNAATSIANELFDLNMPYTDAAWANYPFDMVIELVKQNMLKGIDEIEKDEPDTADDKEPDPTDDEVDQAKALLSRAKIRRRIFSDRVTKRREEVKQQENPVRLRRRMADASVRLRERPKT